MNKYRFLIEACSSTIIGGFKKSGRISRVVITAPLLHPSGELMQHRQRETPETHSNPEQIGMQIALEERAWVQHRAYYGLDEVQRWLRETAPDRTVRNEAIDASKSRMLRL